jgi:hypothetical protein
MQDSVGLQLRTAARIGGVAYIGILIYLPILIAAGIRNAAALIGFLAAMVLAGIVSLVVGRGRRLGEEGAVGPWVVLGASTLALSLATTMYGPLILVPQLLAVNAMPFAIVFQGWRRVVVGCIASAGILVPVTLQATGALPATYLFEAGTMAVQPDMLAMPPLWTLVILTVGGVASIATGILTVGFVRDALSRSERRVHMYSWHLQQMIPEDPAPAA